jgi:cytochrome oxidase Cu insertion factor (SCO1/SenC/PrrC family)
MSCAALTALVLTCFGGAAGAQDLEPSQIDVSQLGPQVGEVVPDFSLPDQNGEIWTRDSIMGPRGAMLVFIRSADW